MSFSAVLAAPFGGLGIQVSGEVVTSIEFLDGDVRTYGGSGFARAAHDQLARYLDDAGFRPDFPFALAGTPFQRRVWQRLRQIPPGSVVRYGDLAVELETAPRAVGGACAANPMVIVVPCHRVVSRQGLGGFMGKAVGRTLSVKQWLLAHEGVTP